MQYAIEPGDDGTTVTIDASVVLSGAAAQFGRTGIIKEMSSRLIGEFIDCVEAKLGVDTEEAAAEIEAADVSGLSLFFSSLGSSLGKFLKRPFRRN